MKQRKRNHKILETAIKLADSNQSDIFLEELEHSLEEAVAHTRTVHGAHIDTAVELANEEKHKLEVLIEKIFKRTMNLEYHIQPQLLGGLRISVGDWKLDATLLNQLRQLTRALKN